ncbi:MAG: hypothetical protein QOI41_1616 [Myxococcales bacterium]|nr:hypothetical protein [Myxococcales bacterium]
MRRPSFTTRSAPTRWPLLLANPPVPPSTRSRRIATIAFGVVGLTVSALTSPLGLPVPLALQIALGLVGLLAIAWAVFARRPVVQMSGTYLEADATGLTRVTRDTPDATKRTVFATWDAPFGVALLASYGRPTALLAFTTPTQTRYVPARIDLPDSHRSEADDELLARIAVLADLDLVDGIAHDAALTATATAALVRHVEGRDKDALGRVYLSDGKGTPIALDRATLAVGERSFDLTSQLEWRPLMFHESTGQAAALYQATWIRQAGSEVVLVAPMPASIVPRETNAHREASGRLGRALTRDLRLLQAPAENPPSRDVRVAIDRPFMMAVRRVLDDAPLASRVLQDPPPPRQKLTAHS